MLRPSSPPIRQGAFESGAFLHLFAHKISQGRPTLFRADLAAALVFADHTLHGMRPYHRVGVNASGRARPVVAPATYGSAVRVLELADLRCSLVTLGYRPSTHIAGNTSGAGGLSLDI